MIFYFDLVKKILSARIQLKNEKEKNTNIYLVFQRNCNLFLINSSSSPPQPKKKIEMKNSKINKASVIVEASSGNTGIALAAICAARGYKCIIAMPENVSEERKRLIVAYGADIILTPSEEIMQGAISEAKRLAAENPNYYYINQFNNENNVIAHFSSTAEEIWRDTEGKVDIVVAGVGTGGTITGIAKFLKDKNPVCKIIGVMPEVPLSIPGIGAGFMPGILKTELIDEIKYVKLDDAINTCKMLSQKEGILVGPSSGAAVFTAINIAKNTEAEHIVVILPDSGERYLSSESLYEQT
jgi:cysteine synthase A